MRRKIFFILFLGIGLFTVITTSELVLFLRRERTRLIDQQVEVLATSLIASGVFESRFEAVQSQVSQALGTREIVTFLSVYDRHLNLKYRNANAQILFGTSVIAPTEKWMTRVVSDHRVRLLNLKAQGGLRWIQVGLLIDQENAEWESLTARAFLIVMVLLIGVAVASFFLSKLLLRPLSDLAVDLRTFSRDLESHRTPEEIFSKWFKESKEKDSFTELISSLVELRARLVGRLQMNEKTLSHMAHELKTPLAVIRAGTESLLGEIQDPKVKSQLVELLHEADRLSETISSFLKWSRFQQVEAAALDTETVILGEILGEACAGLERVYPGRINLTIEGSASLQAQKPHVDQVMQNLISNALKYSTETVQVRLFNFRLQIEDRGAGIPENVLKRLGEPFNSGVSGTGLGLAWVKTLCDRYGWKFRVDSTKTGALVEVDFQSPK